MSDEVRALAARMAARLERIMVSLAKIEEEIDAMLGELAQQAGAFVAMSRIKELAALEREQVSEVLDRGRFAPGEFRRFDPRNPRVILVVAGARGLPPYTPDLSG